MVNGLGRKMGPRRAPSHEPKVRSVFRGFRRVFRRDNFENFMKETDNLGYFGTFSGVFAFLLFFG